MRSASCLVECGQPLFLGRYLMGLLFRSGDHLNGRLLNFVHGDCLFIFPCSKQAGFIHQIFQISTGKSHGRPGNGSQVYVRSDALALGVYFQDLFPTLNVRIANYDLTVKPSRTQQSRIQNIPPVGAWCR